MYTKRSVIVLKPTLKYSNPDYVIKKIKTLCEKRGYSLYRLAEESDIPISRIYNMVNRHNTPKIETLERLCFGLHISLSDFFKDDNFKGDSITEDEREIINIYRDFEAADRERFRSYAEWYRSSVSNSNEDK